MRDSAQIEALERIYQLGSRSFVRYVVEAAHPWPTPAGPSAGPAAEWDARALDALKAWHAAVMESLLPLEALLRGEKVHPALPGWPLEYAQYHLVSPSYLLRPVIDRMQDHVAELSEELPGLRAWPEAEKAAKTLLAGNEVHLSTVEALEAARPKPPPKPAVKKGVSANFW